MYFFTANLPSFQPAYEWFTGELQWIFLIIFIAILVFFVSKKAWMGATLFIVGAAFLGIFLLQPETLLSLAESFASIFEF